MRTYDQALTELKSMVNWLKASNGAFQLLRAADCWRFIGEPNNLYTDNTQTTSHHEDVKRLRDYINSIWSKMTAKH